MRAPMCTSTGVCVGEEGEGEARGLNCGYRIWVGMMRQLGEGEEGSLPDNMKKAKPEGRFLRGPI